MKLVFLAYKDVLESRVAEELTRLGIDYFTQWENVKGKGHNTDAHLGNRPFPGMNNVKMIAFQEESVLPQLRHALLQMNEKIERPDDKIRLFLLPLEEIL